MSARRRWVGAAIGVAVLVVALDAAVRSIGMDAVRTRVDDELSRATGLDIRIEDRLSYDAEANTVFMNYSGMRVRTQEDVDQIKEAVDKLLAPLGRKVYSIVNYDSFDVDPEIANAYMDLVRYVDNTYYLGVSRYTTSGFMRLKLGGGLGERKVASQVYQTRSEAKERLKS